jgi:hypothetical protein
MIPFWGVALGSAAEPAAKLIVAVKIPNPNCEILCIDCMMSPQEPFFGSKTLAADRGKVFTQHQ